MENFFSNSSVTGFFKRNENSNNDCITDYDVRSYIRIMKLFHQRPEAQIKFDDYEFHESEPSFNLNDKFNEPFHLRFYLPKEVIRNVGKKNSKVIIMFNGLNELEHFDLYDILGEYFATNNIAAVLLPTPLNLNRREKENIFPSVRAANDNQPIFYLSYLKSYKELSFLVKKIKGEKDNFDTEDDFDFYENYFDSKNIEITLLGYSLGGLKALAYFMNDFKPSDINRLDDLEYITQMRNKNKFQSCITFNSGANLQDSKVKSLGMNQKDWRYLLSAVDIFLNNKEKKILSKFPDIDDLNMAFKALYFTERDDDPELEKFRIEKVNGILRNFMAVSGGSDLIVNIQQMQQVSPETRINQLIVAKGDHHPTMQKSEWQEVLNRVEKSMLEFINSCGERHYKQNHLVDRIQEIIEEANAGEYVTKNCFQEFNQTHLQHILGSLKNPVRQKEFKKLLHRSKVYFPYFNEIIIRIYGKE